MSSKVPKLRFNGFSGEWEENKESIKIVSGNNYPLNSYDKQGILLIQGLNINPNKLKLDKPIYISPNYQTNNHIIIKKNDILIGLNRPIIDNKLKICLFNQDKAYLYQRAGLLSFSKDKLENKFLYYYLSSNIFLKQLLLELVGSDQPYIKSDLFQKTKNIFPKNIKEQQKIANCLSSLDNLIESQNKKVKALEKHKKGLMQNLFPKDSDKEPKLRFDGFSGEWDEKEFEEIFNRIPSKQYQINSSDYLEIGTYPVIDQGKQNIVAFSNDNSKVIQDNKGLIVFGDHTRILKYIDFDFIVGADGTQLINAKENFDIKFFYYQLLNNIIPNTGYNRHFKFLKEINFRVPCKKKEQKKIANCLSSLDNLIEEQNKKIKTLEKHKKGLMQQLFVNSED
ncbi:MAG: restriction endonuclease subunit S [Campylobacterota bacterium]|nr:restriction endonuclease subunit S [Campylobacterota bacterium]